jgi:hypothetical protein
MMDTATDNQILKQAAEIQAKRDAAKEKRFSITIETVERDIWSGTVEPRSLLFALNEGHGAKVVQP